MRGSILVMILIVGVAGCGSNSGQPGTPLSSNPKILVEHVEGDSQDLPDGMSVHKGRDHSSPSRVDRQPRIIDDAGEAEKTRRLFKESLDELYKQAIVEVKTGDYVFSESMRALKMRRTEAVSDLKSILKDERLEAVSWTKAAEVLIGLKEPLGERFLLESLRSQSPKVRSAALKTLGEWGIAVDFSAPETARQLLQLLGDADEEVVVAAAHLCSRQRIPGAEEKLAAILETRKLRHPGPIAEDLAEITTTVRAVNALLPHMLRDREKKLPQFVSMPYEAILKNPDPQISEPVRATIHQYMLGFKEERYEQNIVRDLAATANADSIPLLTDIYRNAKDPVSRDYAFEGLVRLQPARAKALLLDHIARQRANPLTIRMLRERISDEQEFDQVVPIVLAAYTRSKLPLDTETVRLLLEKFGARGKEVVQSHLEQLDEDAKMWAKWKLAGLDLSSALADLRAAGVIRSSPEDVILKMKKGRRESFETEPLDTSDPDNLLWALVQEEIVVTFDAESDQMPCDHHWLLFDFADATYGKFTPEYATQYWQQKNKDDFDAPYIVQLIYKNRMFRVGAENYGDWYDVEAIHRLVNLALETAGQSERFIALQSRGQEAIFVFADPKAFLPIAAKYGLALADDAAQAMKKGQEFERRAIDRLK
jgi:hypothetical protein